jgi:hypothetical protein
MLKHIILCSAFIALVNAEGKSNTKIFPRRRPTVLPQTRYAVGSSCASGGTHSVNEFGANICEYPGETCPIVKYFTYPDGGTGVELCCTSNSQCNYDAVKNYCHPELQRCVDGSYFGCSEKGGPIFDSCLRDVPVPVRDVPVPDISNKKVKTVVLKQKNLKCVCSDLD